jgi:hypothetical protein
MTDTTSYYLYKMTTDDGGAPCLFENVLSLAICKPTIRRVAKEGSYLLGFAGNKIHPKNGLIYAAKITKKVGGIEYYAAHSSYAARPDCIYERRGVGYEMRRGARFHKEGKELERDLGPEPSFKNAHVLLSTEFRYFGAGRVAIDPDLYPELARLVHSIGQGHHVNVTPSLADEIRRFVDYIFSLEQPEAPKPTHPLEDRCDRDDDYREVPCRTH